MEKEAEGEGEGQAGHFFDARPFLQAEE